MNRYLEIIFLVPEILEVQLYEIFYFYGRENLRCGPLVYDTV